MVSMSDSGSIAPATCTTLSSAKQRTTWATASVSRMLARNWLPSPSPLDAPATSPAMSTNSTVAGTTRAGRATAASASSLGSGTATTPTLGSIVLKGLFSAAIPALVSALNSVDLPTLGSPTMPQRRLMLFGLSRSRSHSRLSSFVRRCGQGRLRPRMQLEHRAFDVSGRKMRPDRQRPSDRLVDQRFVLGAGGMQDVVGHLLFRKLDLARMPDAEPQSPEPA